MIQLNGLTHSPQASRRLRRSNSFRRCPSSGVPTISLNAVTVTPTKYAMHRPSMSAFRSSSSASALRPLASKISFALFMEDMLFTIAFREQTSFSQISILLKLRYLLIFTGLVFRSRVLNRIANLFNRLRQFCVEVFHDLSRFLWTTTQGYHPLFYCDWAL